MRDVELFQVIRRWAILVVAATLLGAAAAYFASARITPRYETSATLVVSQQTDPDFLQRADFETSALLAGVYAQLIPTQPILDLAASTPRLQGLSSFDLRDHVEVEQLDQSQLIRIWGIASDPDLAEAIANGLAQAFIASPEVQQNASVKVSVAEAAAVPDFPVAPRKMVNTAGGAMLAFVVCAAIVAMVEYFDDRISSARQASQFANAPVLAELRHEAPALETFSTHTGLAESYRYIRSMLSIFLHDQAPTSSGRMVLVTSPRIDAMNSRIASNLGIAFSLAGYRTLLIDANFRGSTLHSRFDTSNDRGLSAALDAETKEQQGELSTSFSGLSLLPAGPIPATAVDLLGSPLMAALVDDVRKRYDIVILLSPPIVDVADALALAPLADAALLVVRPGTTVGHDLQQAVADLASGGCPIAGLVLDSSEENERNSEAMARRLELVARNDKRNDKREVSATSTPANSRERRSSQG